MKAGHGRLILHDGTDLLVGYCFVHSRAANDCRGILIGNIRSIDQNTFSGPIKVAFDGENPFVAHVVSHSERHIRFATDLGQLTFRAKGRFSRRSGRPLTVSL